MHEREILSAREPFAVTGYGQGERAGRDRGREAIERIAAPEPLGEVAGDEGFAGADRVDDGDGERGELVPGSVDPGGAAARTPAWCGA
jgi:hypothetical protein